MNNSSHDSQRQARLLALHTADPRAKSTARLVRQTVLENLHLSGGGHFGSCASCVEILLALCASRPLACFEGVGDCVLLSKGHASMTLYAILSLMGSEPLPLGEFGKFGSPLQGHPDHKRLDRIDFSFGSLGQGLAVGLGLALGHQAEGHFVWVIVGDGECQEGMIWEAAMLAARYKIGNLRVIVDSNGEQECGWGHDATLDQRPLPNDLAKWRAFDWSAEEIDGHDVAAVSSWISSQAGSGFDRPSVLVARTHKGMTKSVPLPKFRNHHGALSSAEFTAIQAKLCETKGGPESFADGRLPVAGDNEAVSH